MINSFYPGVVEPSEVVGGCIEIYENLWPDPYKTIENVEAECCDPYSSMSWSKAETVGQGIYQNARTNMNLGITYSAECGNILAQSIHNQFYTMLLATTSGYCSRYSVKQLKHEWYNLLRYEDNQRYNGHNDGDTSSGRAVSAICYLNDDYEGGEIEFEFFKLKIKPESGMLILFPSNFPYKHIAHPVTKGVKYAMVTWMHDEGVK